MHTAPIWTALPAAAAILADCAQNPPARDHRAGTFNRPARMFRVDERVKQLTAIWKAERERLFASSDFDAFADHCAYSVDCAIADARFFALLAQSRNHDAASLRAPLADTLAA